MTQMNCTVAAAYDAIAEPARATLLGTRAMIFEIAAERDVGPLTETLKWGEPAYLTEASKAGSTIRLGLAKGAPAAFFICHTHLVDGFRRDFPQLECDGNRAVLLNGAPRAALGLCLGRALTYHRDKRK